MGAILKISGKELNVDTFDLGWNIKPNTIFRKGDPVRLTKPEGKKIEYSGLIFTVSNAKHSDLKGQIKETAEFLEQHKKYLERLPDYSEIEDIVIDFSFNSRIDRKNVEVQFDYFPADLIKLAGNFNMALWLTQWPCETLNRPKQLCWKRLKKRW